MGRIGWLTANCRNTLWAVFVLRRLETLLISPSHIMISSNTILGTFIPCISYHNVLDNHIDYVLMSTNNYTNEYYIKI